MRRMSVEINLKRIVEANREQIIRLWMEQIWEAKNDNTTANVNMELYESTNHEFVNVILNSILNQGDMEDIENFSERIIHLGWSLSYVTDGLQAFRRVVVENILKNVKDSEEVDTIETVGLIVDSWINPLIRKLVNDYTGNWEEIVSLQRIALQELSAPLIPVIDRITIMPLIGTIDTERAKLIMENLLQGVITHNSEVVLIDITGVPVVDTMVAHHIIQAAEAVRLIGAKCILVGIRPETAQTIVNLGIDLSEFTTTSSLKKGFTRALEITNRKIVSLDGKANVDPLRNVIGPKRGE